MNKIGRLQRRKFFIPNVSRFLLNVLIFYLFPSKIGNWMYYLSIVSVSFSLFWLVIELIVFLDYKKYPLLVYFPFLFDMAVISVLCYISGGINSPFLFMYLMMVISDTIYSDSRLGFNAMIVSSICYATISISIYFGTLEYTNILDYQKNHHWMFYVGVAVFFMYSSAMMHFSIQEVMNQKKKLLDSLESEKQQSEIEKGIALIAQKETENEKIKSESLLLNILPEEIADELKNSGNSKPVFYSSATVLFTDFQGFTEMAETLEPSKLISELDYCFSKFDSLMEKYNLEKLKTIGDSYMCVGGIPKPNKTHAIDCVLAALGMQAIMEDWRAKKIQNSEKSWTIRIGIHSGSLIAGVIGQKKFAYDVWGDTVNLASRMESSGLAEKINISGDTYHFVKDYFDCEYRGKIAAKNKGQVDMYLVNGIKKELQTGEGHPNSIFFKKYNSGIV
ncbi:MAG TPA: adenylate/guanylate cyclase domain-containing protein [Leptospiraceae bacterium]|nr:adenylate/guanylate cyclase domain-containing protein [Leptospiraceae bacterium]